MKKAAFSLDDYKFNRVLIEVDNSPQDDTSIDFNPSGIFDASNSIYELKFDFTAFDEKKGIQSPFINISCVAIFSFIDVNSLDEIPTYFYKNSIAIVFPFIRAFVSSVTLQAGVKPLILPTMNLSSLEEQLKNNTTCK